MEQRDQRATLLCVDEQGGVAGNHRSVAPGGGS
jgi:hypothetical protein